MTNNRNRLASGAEDPQGMDRSLLEYLKPKPEDRYSKLEAYCDLLAKAESCTYSSNITPDALRLLPGQFVASISELSRRWQWQRATVRQFLNGLVSLGQLTMEPLSKSYVFSVTRQQRLSLFVESPSDILVFNAIQFVRYLKGRNTASQVAQSYNSYFNKVMELEPTEIDGDRLDGLLLRHQCMVFDSLAKSILTVLDMEKQMPDGLSDSIGLLFGKDHVWDWQKVIAVLGILAVSIRERTKPGDMAAAVSGYSKAEVILLDCIFGYYMSGSTASGSDGTPRLALSSADNKTDGRHGNAPLVENRTD